MPIEVTQLKDKPQMIPVCTECLSSILEYSMRGTVQSGWRKFFGLPYCCIICPTCHSIVGYEKPD